MNMIFEHENTLFAEIKKNLNEVELKQFVSDGLCWSDIRCGKYLPGEVYLEMENLYMSLRPKIVFLCKEPNGNAGEDYRDWHWAERKCYVTFGDSLALWLEGILSTTSMDFPTVKELRMNREIFTERPFVLVNVKKTAGRSRSDWNVIFEYAQRYASLLRNQLDLYNPDIIVCCGSSDDDACDERMLGIAKKYLYPDCHFSRINNFCHYSKEKHLLLIDSYHPTARVSRNWKFDKMFECYREFLREQI